MTRAPLIGLSGRRKSGDKITDMLEPLKHLEVDLYFSNYARGVLAAGGLPVHLPVDADPLAYLDHLDGVLLSGGADVEPKHYGAELNEHTDFEAERDELELALFGGALEHNLPVLGICRGLQVMNIQAGGTLNQHIPEHARYEDGPTALIHGVEVEPDSRLASIYDGPIRVNSLHHQTVDQVGEGFIVTGRAEDGTVEAMEMPGRPVVAVQWHPEMLDSSDPIFVWLVDQAREAQAAA